MSNKYDSAIRMLLARPKLHAQSIESLEDQFTLLLTFLSPESLGKYGDWIYGEYRTIGMLSSQVKSMEEAAEKLEDFYTYLMSD